MKGFMKEILCVQMNNKRFSLCTLPGKTESMRGIFRNNDSFSRAELFCPLLHRTFKFAFLHKPNQRIIDFSLRNLPWLGDFPEREIQRKQADVFQNTGEIFQLLRSVQRRERIFVFIAVNRAHCR